MLSYEQALRKPSHHANLTEAEEEGWETLEICPCVEPWSVLRMTLVGGSFLMPSFIRAHPKQAFSKMG